MHQGPGGRDDADMGESSIHRVALLGVATLAVVAAGCSDDGGDRGSTSAVGPAPEAALDTVPEAAAEIMAQPAYESARWLYHVADAESGEVLLADRADELVFTASTAKGFFVGSVYEVLGPDTTLTTPVYATTPVADGAVAGDLVLVASGDLALGGRGAAGRVHGPHVQRRLGRPPLRQHRPQRHAGR